MFTQSCILFSNSLSLNQTRKLVHDTYTILVSQQFNLGTVFNLSPGQTKQCSVLISVLNSFPTRHAFRLPSLNLNQISTTIDGHARSLLYINRL